MRGLQKIVAVQRVAVLVVAVVVLTGCSSLFLPKRASVDLYDVTPGALASTAASDLPGTAGWTLAVAEPLATGGIGGNQIIVRPDPLRLQPLSGARWSERAPAMVQTLLIELFESSGAMHAVGRSGAGAFDYSLETELRAFEAECFDGPAQCTARVRIQARLVALPLRHIVAARSFESAVPTSAESNDHIVQALDTALQNAGRELLRWTLDTTPDIEHREH